MTTTCDHVDRGDLITADFINHCILDRLADLDKRLSDLETAGPPPTVNTTTVPDIIGHTVKEAMTDLQKANLKMGDLSDEANLPIAGTSIFDVGDWIVIAMDPQKNNKVKVDSEVDLTLRSQEEKPPVGPYISGLKPSSLSVTDASSSIDLIIYGGNFETAAGKTKVTVGTRTPTTTTVKSTSEIDITTALPAGLKEGTNQVTVNVVTSVGSASATLYVTYTKGTQLGGIIDNIVDDSGSILIDPVGPITEWYIDPGDLYIRIKQGDKYINPGDIMVIQGNNLSYNVIESAVNMIILGKSVTVPIASQSSDGKSVTVVMPTIKVDEKAMTMNVEGPGMQSQTLGITQSGMSTGLSVQVTAMTSMGTVANTNPVQITARATMG